MKRVIISLFLACLCSGVSAQLISTGLLDVMKEYGSVNRWTGVNSICAYDDTLYASTFYGLFYYDLKNEKSWKHYGSFTYFTEEFVKDGDNIVAIVKPSYKNPSDDVFDKSAQAVLYSNDKGETYSVKEVEFYTHVPFRINSLSQNPNNRKQLYLVKDVDGEFLTKGLYKSHDFGKTWEECLIEDEHSGESAHMKCCGRVFVNPYDASNCFLVGTMGTVRYEDKYIGRYLFTEDGFATVDSLQFIDDEAMNRLMIPFSIAFGKDNTMLMASKRGLLKSVDSGRTWEFKLKLTYRIHPNMFLDIIYDSNKPDIVYSVDVYGYPYGDDGRYYDPHVYISYNGGEDWSEYLTIDGFYHSINQQYLGFFDGYFPHKVLFHYDNKLFICCDDDVFYLDTTDIQTGISSVSTEDCIGDGFIYDLQGRRLSAEPAHGIYIKDGKKIAR